KQGLTYAQQSDQVMAALKAQSPEVTLQRVEVENNTAERAIRPLVLGRRNYLFAGSDGGGQSAAVIYSLIGTARLNSIEPFAYLRTVFERIADHPI
ncbi:transposase domain-containing protein, partial [Burkholderia sp. SIMBA_051]|uniref:transposase domain-containing protein n=1 Tax=Burkholderia sp. SIMBA_051 TaxID=3085792 RepID=UPI00397BE5BF